MEKCIVELMKSTKPFMTVNMGSSSVNSLFSLLALVQCDRKGLMSVKGLFLDVQADDNLVMSEMDDVRLFTSIPWIDRVIFGNLSAVSTVIKNRMFQEGALRATIVRSWSDEIPENWHNGTAWEIPQDLTLLDNMQNQYYDPARKPTKAKCGCASARWMNTDNRVLRHLMCRLLCDAVKVMHIHGHDFAYTPKDISGKREPQKANAILKYLSPANTVKNYYNKNSKETEMAWAKKYTMETFLFCWSTWVEHKLCPFNKAQTFIVMPLLGGMKSPATGLTDMTNNHEYQTPVKNLDRLMQYSFSTFLERILRNGGYEWFKKNGGEKAIHYFTDGPRKKAKAKEGLSSEEETVDEEEAIDEEESVGVNQPDAEAEVLPLAPIAKGVSELLAGEGGDDGDNDSKNTPEGKSKRKSSGGGSAKSSTRKSSTKKSKQNGSPASVAMAKKKAIRLLHTNGAKLFSEQAFGRGSVAQTMNDDEIVETISFLVMKGCVTGITLNETAIEVMNRESRKKTNPVNGTLRNCMLHAHAEALHSSLIREDDVEIKFTADAAAPAPPKVTRRQSPRRQKSTGDDENMEEEEEDDSATKRSSTGGGCKPKPRKLDKDDEDDDNDHFGDDGAFYGDPKEARANREEARTNRESGRNQSSSDKVNTSEATEAKDTDSVFWGCHTNEQSMQDSVQDLNAFVTQVSMDEEDTKGCDLMNRLACDMISDIDDNDSEDDEEVQSTTDNTIFPYLIHVNTH